MSATDPKQSLNEQSIPESHSARTMSNRSLILLSIVLAVPAQYLFLLIPLLHEFITVGITHPAGTGDFGCSNYHEAGLSRCSLGAMLANPLIGIGVANSLSFGLYSVFFVGVNAALLGLGRTLYRRITLSSE